MESFLLNILDAVKYLKDCCSIFDGLIPQSFGCYYCGITNDIERRVREHNAECLGYIKAETAQDAKDLEVLMHEEGFDTGDQLGNGSSDSVYVYVYRKTSNTFE